MSGLNKWSNLTNYKHYYGYYLEKIEWYSYLNLFLSKQWNYIYLILFQYSLQKIFQFYKKYCIPKIEYGMQKYQLHLLLLVCHPFGKIHRLLYNFYNQYFQYWMA